MFLTLKLFFFCQLSLSVALVSSSGWGQQGGGWQGGDQQRSMQVIRPPPKGKMQKTKREK